MLEAGVQEAIHGAEMLREVLGGAHADVQDAQAGEDARQAAVFGGGDAFDDILGGLFAHALEVEELFFFEAVEIRDGFDQATLEKLLNEGRANFGDVHLVAAGPEADAFGELVGAIGIEAADEAAVVLEVFVVATGAFSGAFDFFCVFGAFFGDDADDVGDDFAGFFDQDAVVEVDVLAGDFVKVVEAGAVDVGAGDEGDGVEFADGGDGAGFADLENDADEFGLGLFGLIFVGDAPARGLGGGAELIAAGRSGRV